ncbi:MAG: hypothetical protein F6K10_19215 [Moorea sp. SIO2B7]|nr:hypothetical protein [Moorena sp. SIO2B7]
MYYFISKKDAAISAAETYAAEWNVPWERVTKIKKHRALLIFIEGFTISFESGGGVGEVEVSCPDRITRFEFMPSDSTHFMLPLWAAYPTYDSVTSGWRQGYGEVYKYRWHDWYDKLSDEKRTEYRERFPPPKDEELCWADFYELIADVPADYNSIPDFLMGRVPKNDA